MATTTSSNRSTFTPRTSVAVVDRLRNHHLLKSKQLDDDASGTIFDKYLEFLDTKRMFLTASDVEKLGEYRTELDDALRHGDVQPAFDIYNVFRQRALERVEYEVALLQRGVEQFDFTLDESIQLDREEAPWPADGAELRNLWRLALKSRVLAGKLSGETLDAIGETLQKRSKNSLRLIRQTRSEDVFQLFINAFTQTYDKHTQYFSPRDSEDFNIHMSLSLEGIGAVLGTADEYTVVHRLVKGGPADLDGDLKPTDRIVAVSQGANHPLVDIVGWRTDEVVELIRGPKGSPVRLKVMAAGPDVTDTRIVEIVRDVVKLEEQAASRSWLDLRRGDRTRRIGVVTVPTFYIDFKAQREGDPNYTSTTRDVARLIGELRDESIDGLIVRSAQQRRRLVAGSRGAGGAVRGFRPGRSGVESATTPRRVPRSRRRRGVERPAGGDGKWPLGVGFGDLRRRGAGLRPRRGGGQPDLRQGHRAEPGAAAARRTQNHRAALLPHLRRWHGAKRRGAGHRVSRARRPLAGSPDH